MKGIINIKIKLLSLLFLLGFAGPGWAQTNAKVDSLTQLLNAAPPDSTKVEILVELWRTTAYNNPQQGVEYAYEIIKESQKIDFKPGIATGYQRLGIAQSFLGHRDSVVLNYRKALSIYESLEAKALQGVMLYNIGLEFHDASDYDSALYYINRAEELFVQEGDSSRVGAVFQARGSTYQEKGNYYMALQSFLTASVIYAKYKDPSRLAMSFVDIGDSYFLMQEFVTAFSYYQKALNAAESSDDQQLVATALINIGSSYNELNNYDSAKYFLNKGVDLAKKLQTPFLITHAVSTLALYYYEQENYELALPLFEEGLALSQEIEYNLFTAANLINIAWIQYHKNQLSEAELNVTRGLQIAQETETKENIKSALELLSKVNEKRGNYQLALTYHQQFKELNDSIYNTTKSSRIAELQTLYETEKKENEIAQQKEEITILNQQAKIDELRNYLLGAGLIAAIIISGLIIMGVYQRMKRAQLVQSQQKINYEKEINHNKKQLTTHTLHLVQKNELLTNLKEKITEIKKHSTESKKDLNRLLQLIKNDHNTDKDWDNFKMYFEQVHEDFDAKLRARINDLTNNEMRLAALMKMNLSSKEIASILNISPDSVNKARYRLRKKLNLAADDSLHNFLLSL